MKILVIDDSAVHLESAQLTLIGHEVTLCSSHDKALDLLKQQDTEEA
jgi:CheY-like chemotaxis protein